MADQHKGRFGRFPILAIAVTALLQVGCERAAPVTYHIPKEERSANLPLPGMSEEAPPSATAELSPGDIFYAAPDGWEEFPPLGIRRANFHLAGDLAGATEVTVLAFPGDLGGELAVVNRWAGQLGREPFTAEETAGVSEHVSISDHPGLLVRLEASSESILGAILPFHGFTWLFKLQGDPATVRAQETAMKEFLGSIHLPDPGHQ